MAEYGYVIAVERPLTEAASVLLEGELRQLCNARNITVQKHEATFTSDLSLAEVEPILRQLSTRFSRIELRGGTMSE